MSATSFKLVGIDRTAVFQVGTRLRLKQGGAYKYFIVVSSAFSTDTTVTITGGTDYTLANAAITDNYYSYAANPQGYPGWFNFTPTLVGWSATTTLTARFAVIGRVCHLKINIAGTSNSATATATLPIAAGSGSSFAVSGAICADNGISLTTPGRCFIGASATVLTCNKDFAGNGFTASGGKNVNTSIAYEI